MSLQGWFVWDPGGLRLLALLCQPPTVWHDCGRAQGAQDAKGVFLWGIKKKNPNPITWVFWVFRVVFFYWRIAFFKWKRVRWVGRLNLYLKLYLNLNLNPLFSVGLSQGWNGVGKLVLQQCLLRCGFPGQGGIALSLLLAQTYLRCGCFTPFLSQTGLRLVLPFALGSLDHHRNAWRLWTDFNPPLSLPKSQTTFTSRDCRKNPTFNKKLPTMKIYFLGKFFLLRYKNASPWKYKPSSLKTVVGGI